MADSGRKINLILGAHAHVPYGSADQEFENVYEKRLKPFISNLYKYPRIQAALHYSGVLLYWIERSHPELFMLIEDMVSRRQAELLGGGFYEPMLPLLPLQDKIGQIELFTTYLRKHFGKRPLGCWIPGYAWEHNLIAPLCTCGMGYAFLGEEQFIKAGLKPNELYQPCLSEDQGKLLTVFPVFHSLEKELAEKNAQAVFKKLHDRLPEGTGHTVLVLPQKIFSTQDEAADYSWNRFFEEITLSEAIIESSCPSKILKGSGKLRKICLPESAGNGGARCFLISHPEANGIYAKMIFTNLLINQLRGDKARKLNAREELWKAQGYSLFSSVSDLYRHNLRKAAYRSLLGAERITREKTKFAPSVLQLDFDFDGINEYLFQEQKINCYIQTQGAGVFELDYLPKAWNYLDTCNYYGEAQPIPGVPAAAPVAKPPQRRTAFNDTFYSADTDCHALSGAAIFPLRCCAEESYSVKDPEKNRGKAVFFLPPDESKPFGSIGIEKTYSLKKDTLALAYDLSNHGENALAFKFIPEIEMSFPGEGQGYIRLFKCKTGAKDAVAAGPLISDTESVKIQDIKNEVQITLASSVSFDFCIKHRRISHNGAEFYQSSTIMPVISLELKAGQSWSAEFSLKFAN